jgi:aspartyl-tRNA(Asn)/glutamyl-tRNA(Gln) amidotransferase subunit A
MPSLDLVNATIVSLGKLIKTKKVSPVEVTEATFERIQRLEPTLKAFTTPTPDYAMDKAKYAEKEVMAGQYRGPLHGIPYTLKDVIATKDVRTTFGNIRGKDFKPKESATVHTLLEDAGAILVGKVYSQIGRGDTPLDCYNPWDPRLSPGTSSAGSGAATAASMGLVSIGTDTGGSVRHPASNCNLVGLRATFGRISRHGVLAPSWTHDQAGPLAKTVEDCAIVAQALARYDPKDPISVNAPPANYRAALKRGVKGVRIGLPRDRWIWERDQEEVESMVKKAVDVLAGLGAEVKEVNLPLAAECRAAHFKLTQPETAVMWPEVFGPEEVAAWPEIHRVIEEGRAQPFHEYLHAMHKAARINQELFEELTKVDVIAIPTGATMGDRADSETTIIRGKEVPARSRAVYLNGLASMAGAPALSVPCGFYQDRLPVGMMLMGNKLSEGLLFRVAYAYEQSTDWHRRHPDI